MRIQNSFRVGLVGTLGVGLGLLLITSITSLATVLTYVGAALFLSLGLDPLVSWLEKRKLPRWAAILVVVVVVLAAVATLILTIIPLISEQVGMFIKTLPNIITNLSDKVWIDALNAQLGGWVDVNALLTEAAAWLKDPANISGLAGGALAVGVSLVNGFFGAIIVIILTLYFTAALNSIKAFTYKMIPATKRDKFIQLSGQITDGVGRYVIGQITLGLVNGVLTFLLLTIIGGRAPIVFAFIAFVFSLIPLVGTISGSAIIVLSQFVLTDGTVALIAIIYYLIYMQVEAYVISPRIMNKAVSVPGSIVVIAAIAGGSLLGILGALVAIPVAASIIIIVKEVLLPRQEKL
jgi:predicted PurR-regulated permease PerM